MISNTEEYGKHFASITRPVRILHMANGIDGGAGLGLVRLHAALLQYGIDSRILVSALPPDDKTSRTTVCSKLHGTDILRKLFPAILHKMDIWHSPYYRGKLAELYAKQRWNRFFHSGRSVRRLDSENCVRWADIVHLHWVGNMLDVPTFFRRVHKPIVWTLRDEWPLIGGFHYRTDMPENLPGWISRIDADSQRLKELAYQRHGNITFVSLSSAMAEFAKSTTAGAGRVIRVIPNPIDGRLFRPGDGLSVRREFGIDPGSIVISFVAQRINDSRKGLSDLLKATSTLGIDKPVIICVGSGEPPSGVPDRVRVICTGPVSDPFRLSAIYSASTLFAAPSKAESFGKTLTEALACGIPVVSYPNDGAKDILHEKVGVLASSFSPIAFRDAMQKALSRSFDPTETRRDALSRFSAETVAAAHARLYNHLLEQRQPFAD